MSGDVRATVSSIQKATKRQRKKDILAGVESLQAILSLLDLSSPSESSIQKLIASIRSPLLPLYADHADPMLGFCRAVLIYISDKKIGAFTGPGKDALRELWEPVLESLINGVIDFLEYSTKKTDEIKSCIGGKLYPTFCRLYFPKEQDDIISVGPSLLSTVYMLMSDAAIRHSDNRRRLRSSDSLGARRIGWMLAQTKEFVVIEHLLEVFATALPSSKDQGGKSRQQYIEDVFDPALFHSHGEAIKILANMRSADWSETSPHIMAALAEGSLAYPQPFDVTDFLVGGVPEKLDYGKLYIDNKGFYANVEQDEAFDHLKAAYSTVIDIRIIQSQNAVKVVHVTLESPPVVGKEPYCTAQSGRNYNLKFLVQATDLDRFKNSLKARGLGGKMLSGGKRVSTAEVVVEFDKDPVTPLPSTQSKVKRVEEVWNSSTVEGPIVLEPTSPLLNDSGDVLPAPPKSTRPKPRPKQAGVDKEGDSNKDPFVISRKRMRVPDSDDEADDGKKKSRTGTSTSVKGRPTEAVVPLADVPRRPLRDKKRPSPASEALTLGSTDGHPPAAKRARPSDKENPRSKTATRELFNMQKPGKPARVAKRYGKAGRSSSPGRKSGRPSSPQTVIATNIASDFDFIPGGEVVKSGGAGKAPPKRQGKVTEKPAETKVKIAAVTKGRKAGNGKPEEKTAQKKGRAIDKGKSTSSASSDPIEEDISISKSARTRNNELLASKATSTIAKKAELTNARPVADVADTSKKSSEATNTTRKSESAPWEDIMSVQRTPAKSQGKSKTSKLLAAMDNNLSSPIFGGFDEPLTPIQESDTEVYMDFVQDLPVVTSDAELATSLALDSANDSRIPTHIDLTKDSPLPHKSGNSKSRLSSADPQILARDPTAPPASASSTDVVTEPAGRPIAARKTDATSAKKLLSNAARPRSHVKASLVNAQNAGPIHLQNPSGLRADGDDVHLQAAYSRISDRHEAMPPPPSPVPARPSSTAKDVFASSPRRQERRTSGSTTLANDSAQILHSILRSTGLSRHAPRLHETGLPITKGNLIAGMYPPSPSPPEILQRTKSQEGIRKGRRDYKSQDTPIGRASPLVDKLARDVPFPRPAKVYTRPEATKARAYAGIEDIIEVLNDIHEVIIDKVSGRFVAVKKEVRVGRHSILIDAANDFRVMNRESLEHYETVFSLQEEYANHCRNIVDAWAALHQAGRDLTKSIVEVVQRHDRGSLVMKFPTSLVPSLPESLKSAS